MNAQKSVPARLASTPADYARLGLQTRGIAQWEDGLRTDASPGTFEWWYFDAHLNDGTILVVVFQTKDYLAPHGPLAPRIRIELTLPDGTHVSRVSDFDPSEFHAAKERCDVQIGENNRFSGDLHTYTIRTQVEGIEIDARLTASISPWRPQTGIWLFGEQEERYFAWLPSVPQGSVDITYTVEGVQRTSSGFGYHDHNWGNTSPLELLHHWYWTRGEAGPYSVISICLTAEEEFGFCELPSFMLTRDGKLLGSDPTAIKLDELDCYTDEATGKTVAGVLRFTYPDGDDTYVVSFARRKDLKIARFIDVLPEGLRKQQAQAAGMDGAYLRFGGDLRIERYRNDQLLESHQNEALWELMYFGKNREG